MNCYYTIAEHHQENEREKATRQEAIFSNQPAVWTLPPSVRLNFCCTFFTNWGFGNASGAVEAKHLISSSDTNVAKSTRGKLFTKKALTSSKVFVFFESLRFSRTQTMFAVLGAFPFIERRRRLMRILVVVPMLLQQMEGE